MAVPSSHPYLASRICATYSGVWTVRARDDNPNEDASAGEASRWPPFARFAPPLSFGWINEARDYDASNSFQQQWVDGESGQEAGGVASYDWSLPDGGGSISGGSSSTATVTWTSRGVKRIRCEVTDDSGATREGTRWVHVHDRPDSATQTEPVIAAIELVSGSSSLPGRGSGGTEITLRLWDQDHLETYQRGSAIAVYADEYRGATRSLTKHAEGEFFSGFVDRVERRYGPYEDEVLLHCVTIERLFGRDTNEGADHIFLDRQFATNLQIVSGIGAGALPASPLFTVYPWHQFQQLTIGKVFSHLINFHIQVEVGGTTYDAAQVCDMLRDFWNDGDPADNQVWGLNIPRGPIWRGIENMLPNGAWTVYSTRDSRVSITKIHQAKATPDAVVDDIDQRYVLAPITPVDNEETQVRQCIIFQTPASLRSINIAALIAKWPSTPGATGSLLQPNTPFWVGSANAAQALAKALYDDANSTAMLEVELPGLTFDLFNIFRATLDGAAPLLTYPAASPWTNKKFFVTRIVWSRDHESMGPIVQRVLGREIAIS